ANNCLDETEKIVLFTMDRELIADYIWNVEGHDMRYEILKFGFDPPYPLWSDPMPYVGNVTADPDDDGTVVIKAKGEGLLESCEISLESTELIDEIPTENSGYPKDRFRARNTILHDPAKIDFRNMPVAGRFHGLPHGIDVLDKFE